MKVIVIRLQAQVLENPEVDLCTDYLMSDRSKLGYKTQTYDPLIPYLKVLHLIIDGPHPDRDSDGWKLETARLKSTKFPEEQFFLKSASCLETFNSEKCLLSGLKDIVDLNNSETSPILLVQSYKLNCVKCGFGDACGGGFGVTIEGETLFSI